MLLQSMTQTKASINRCTRMMIDYEEGGSETFGAGLVKAKGGPISGEALLQQSRAMATADELRRNPSNDDEGQSRFSGIMPPIQERNHAHADYVVSETADVHSAAIGLKENPIQKEDDLPSGLESKAHESNMMGLSGVEAISGK
nr:hypothetical protein CFP56_40446 [Quercus suber]